ncbi:MAG: hypothetical protein ABIR06_19040 [Cyclobacteriaceae bacterium]
MKKIMFALCLMGGSVVLVNAQDTQDTTSTQYKTETPASQDGQSKNQDALGQNQDQERERIQSTELPDAVKRSLEGQEYRGWLINGAYKGKGVADASSSSMESDSTSTDANKTETTKEEGDKDSMGAQGEEIYIVELKNGAQTKTINFDKDGKKMEGQDEMEGQENNQLNQDGQINPNGESSPNEQADPNQSSETEKSQSDKDNANKNENSSTTDQNTSKDQSSTTPTKNPQ